MKVDVVAFLHLCVGGAALVVVAFMVLTLIWFPDPVAFGFLLVASFASLAWGLAHAIAGFGLLQRRSWSRLLALVLGGFQLLNWPLGPIVGVPTAVFLWKQDALAEPSALRGGARLGCAVSSLLFGAVALPTGFLALMAVMFVVFDLFEPRIELTSEQAEAICRISDVPGAPPATRESTERTGPMLHYEAAAGDMAMVVRAILARHQNADEYSWSTEHFDPREHFFALRHGLRFEDRTELPFDAAYGHWGASTSPPGATIQMIDDHVNLTVSLAGVAPSDVHELERWFGRCWAALHALPPAEG